MENKKQNKKQKSEEQLLSERLIRFARFRFAVRKSISESGGKDGRSFHGKYITIKKVMTAIEGLCKEYKFQYFPSHEVINNGSEYPFTKAILSWWCMESGLEIKQARREEVLVSERDLCPSEKIEDGVPIKQKQKNLVHFRGSVKTYTTRTQLLESLCIYISDDSGDSKFYTDKKKLKNQAHPADYNF